MRKFWMSLSISSQVIRFQRWSFGVIFAAALGIGGGAPAPAAPSVPEAEEDLPGAHAPSALRNPWETGLEATSPCGVARCTWQRTVGGQFEDKAHAVAADGAGGAFVVGASRGNGPFHLAWAMRTDRSGKTLWRRFFGGAQSDQFFGVAPAADGGMLAIGHTRSEGAGESDLWLVRLDRDGRTLWTRTFGGPQNDRGRAIVRTEDNAFIAVGFTASFGSGDRDFWALRIEDDGELAWGRTFGGAKGDYGFDVKALPGGDVIAAGHGWRDAERGYDLWVFRLTPEGEVVWRRELDRSSFDAGATLAMTGDGGMTVVGATRGDGGGSFNDDIWAVRLDAGGVVLWDRVLGGARPDTPFAAAPLAGGDIAIAAITWSYGAGAGDAWIVRLDPLGATRWERVFGGPVWDRPTGLIATEDDGILMVGHTSSRGAGYEDGWLLRLDDQGGL